MQLHLVSVFAQNIHELCNKFLAFSCDGWKIWLLINSKTFQDVEHISTNLSYKRYFYVLWLLLDVGISLFHKQKKLVYSFWSIEIVTKSFSYRPLFLLKHLVEFSICIVPFLTCLINIALSQNGLYIFEKFIKLFFFFNGFSERFFHRIVH